MMRAIAVQADRRSPAMPGIPMVTKTGLKHFDVDAWFGLFAPASTPPTIVSRIDRGESGIFASADVRNRPAQLGLDFFATSPLVWDDYIESQIALLRLLTREAELQPE